MTKLYSICLPVFMLGLAAPAIGQVATTARASTTSSVATQLPHISVASAGSTKGGSPVILIPGLSSPRAVWDGSVAVLAKTHPVYVVQVNGFAGDAPRDNLKPGILDGVVADLHGYIASHKLAGAAVVGHSMGGLVGLMLAKTHPADVGRLMIVDSLPYIGEIFVPGATVAMIEPQAKIMRDAMAASYGKPADPAANAALSARMALKPASRATVSSWVAATDMRVSAQAMYEDMTTDLRPDMSGITVPITMVYPWNDAGPTRDAASALYRKAYSAAPKVTFVDIGDAAHFVMLDQPAAFEAALMGFVGK